MLFRLLLASTSSSGNPISPIGRARDMIDLVCSVDWTALGTCVQAGVVLLGTAFGVWQYLVFQRNERIRRTLKIMSDFDTKRQIGTSGTEMTAARAVPLVQAAGANKAAFKTGFEDFVAARNTPIGRQYLVSSDAVVTIVNYFSDAARLASRNLIDKELFFEARSYAFTLVLGPAKELLAIEGRNYDLDDLDAFAAEAEAYLEKHPAVKPRTNTTPA